MRGEGRRAKGVLEEAGARYDVVEVDKLGDEGYAWRVELAALTGSGTVPQVPPPPPPPALCPGP
jgi:glutaredoxin